ncbi:Tubulin polyglutamylase complex subunit 2 [Chytriomyces hyalinus]|nr:Tubulin polyglutamylase complex subunit 2 [Chytriomyces hyalinus]
MTRKSNALDAMLGGCIRYLESCIGVSRVTVGTADPPPSTAQAVRQWESAASERVQCSCPNLQNAHIKLPSDLLAFYEMTDGLSVTWASRFKAAEPPTHQIQGKPIQLRNALGNIHVNKLEGVTMIPVQGYGAISLDGVDPQALVGLALPPGPAFLLHDMGPTIGGVCLVYPLPAPDDQQHQLDNPQIWFCSTRSLQWYYLANSFSNYMRVAVAHLGVCGWPQIFTDMGVPQEVLDWLSLYSPAQAKAVRQLRAKVFSRVSEPAKPSLPMASTDKAKEDSEWDLDATLQIIKNLQTNKTRKADVTGNLNINSNLSVSVALTGSLPDGASAVSSSLPSSIPGTLSANATPTSAGMKVGGVSSSLLR